MEVNGKYEAERGDMNDAFQCDEGRKGKILAEEVYNVNRDTL